MRIEPLGDAAFLLRDLDAPAYLVAARLQGQNLPGLIEAVCGYETVGLYVDPDLFDVAMVSPEDWRRASTLTPALSLEEEAGETAIEIPVCYGEGPDLPEAARVLGLSTDELSRLHCGTAYRCFAIGFSPGFPYLGYLDEQISGLARRPTPRVRVPAGSVAITGRQTGIYTVDRPGGWWLIGRTPLTLVDVADGYFPIKAGAEVRFVPIDAAEYRRRLGERL